MKLLFIGGTGVISSACTEKCINNGVELYLLNRGKSGREVPCGVKFFSADINDIPKCKELLSGHHFDAVVNWIVYDTEQAKRDYNLFKDITDQYIFISSASVYAKPPTLNLTEDHKIYNPGWEYSNKKIEVENYFNSLNDFPVTIVRPSHTYDKTKIPLQGGYTSLYRMLQGKEVIVHGDGTTIWTLTHHKDFAKGFVPLLGNQKAVGETYHITSEEHLTWDEINTLMASAAGVVPKIVHVPSDFIYKKNKDWGDGLLGDKAYNMVLDNSKIRSIAPEFRCEIPFSVGAEEIVEWYKNNPEHQIVNDSLNDLMDEMIKIFK